MNYDVVYFTLNSGSLIDGWKVSSAVSIINELVDRKLLAVVFLRGTGESIPLRLGFVNQGYINYTDGIRTKLLLENYPELRSENINYFLTKYQNEIHTHSYTVDPNVNEPPIEVTNCIELADSFMCGLKLNTLTQVSDWHFLARSINETELYSWIVHRTKKVMFTPWYGYSHGNKCQHDLALYASRYLLFDHLKQHGCFFHNLHAKSLNYQLSDLVIN